MQSLPTVYEANAQCITLVIQLIVVSLLYRKRRTFAEVLPTADPLILDVVSKLLHFNPTRRLTATQALEHPYVAK